MAELDSAVGAMREQYALFRKAGTSLQPAPDGSLVVAASPPPPLEWRRQLPALGRLALAPSPVRDSLVAPPPPEYGRVLQLLRAIRCANA